MSLTTHSQHDNMFNMLRRADTETDRNRNRRSSAVVWASGFHRAHSSLRETSSLGWYLASTRKQNQILTHNNNRPSSVLRQPRSGLVRVPRRNATHQEKVYQGSSSGKELVRRVRNVEYRSDSPDVLLGLFEAIRHDDQKLIERMIRENSIANASDRMGTVPLMVVAATTGNASTGEMLMRFGARHNAAQNIVGESCIHIAARNGHASFLRMLLRKRDKDGEFADVDLATATGLTALMLASQSGHAEVVDVLLNQGNANKRIADSQGMRAIDYARESGYPHIVSQFVIGTRPKLASQNRHLDGKKSSLPLWKLPGGCQDTINAGQSLRGKTLLVFNQIARGWRPRNLDA